jgi:hypothetical protein
MMQSLARLLIVAGIALALVGLLLLVLPQLGSGRLPGDIVVRGKRTVILIPLATSLLLSLLLTALLWLFKR